MKRIASITLSVVFLAACSSFGKDAAKANPFNKVLSAVPSAELPAKAADLILQTKPADREATTVQVVKGAVGMNPAAAPAIVGAVARAVPEMASVAAAAAAAEQPKQARAIAKAAAAAAPTQAAQVVEAVCRVAPKEYRAVATEVAETVPGANKEILKALSKALPELKPSLDRAMVGYGGNVVSVGDTLAQATQIAKAETEPTIQSLPTLPTRGALLSRGPAVGPPYVPLTGTATNVTSGTSGEVPTGGRNYAAP
jgi:hypothetical protein